MKTNFVQRTAAMLLCVLLCSLTAFPLMGAAFATEDGQYPACICNTRCTETAVNADCPICAQDVTACTGAEPTTEPAATEPEQSEEPVTMEPEITCFCDVRCTETTLNADCPICVQDATACTDAEPEQPAEPAPTEPATDPTPTEPEITCFCDVRCTETTLNADCPICVQDVTACTGAEPEQPTEPVPTEPEPVCTCESKCELGAVNGNCAICASDLTGCTGKAPDPIPESDLSIQITPPSGWATKSAAAEFRITDEAGAGFALAQVKIEKSGQWRDVTDDLKQRENRWYGEIDLSENCTVYVCVTGYDGKVFEKSRYIECFDRTAPTLRASIDGRLLRAEASDDLSGVAAIYIDGEKYTGLTNGTLDVPLKDLPDDYEQLSVQAVDEAGNKSKIVQVKNPNYEEPADEKKQEPATTPAQTATTAPASSTPAATTPVNTTAAATAPATAASTNTAAANTAVTKTSASASAAPDEEPDTTPREAVPLTPDGQATVLDNATGEDGKEFYTIQTPDENVFYLIIDNQRDTDNVYFLNAVTEADLMALAVKEDNTPLEESIPEPEPVCVCEEKCAAGAVNTDCPVCVLNLKDCAGKAPVTDTEAEAEPEKEETGGSAGTLILILLAALAAGGAGYYLKIYKPKKDLDDAEDFDELTGGDEEETINEDEEPGAPEEPQPAAYGEPEEPDYPDAYDEEDD